MAVALFRRAPSGKYLCEIWTSRVHPGQAEDDAKGPIRRDQSLRSLIESRCRQDGIERAKPLMGDIKRQTPLEIVGSCG
jgi:hypothetical protein